MTFKFLFFILFYAVGAYKDPLTAPGRSVMVHLFEWKWNDIAKECARFLGPRGFAGIQVSPPMEHALVNDPYRPWWQRYQPVSYKLNSRSGTEEEFISMVSKCNENGVRIYVDVLLNHMGATSGVGSSGTNCDVGKLSFPGIPYGPNDFNDKKCRSFNGGINNWNDIFEVRECRLVGLPDLDTSSEYVRNKLAELLNRFIDIGVAGFRLDAAKHMWPGDIQAILSKTKNAREDIFGKNKRPFIYQEVIDYGGEPISGREYSFARVTEFRYGIKLSDIVAKRHNQQMKYLKNFGHSWGFYPDDDALVFIDNHDTQRDNHGILTYKQSREYKIATVFMLAWPYGFAQIMSSYDFPYDKNWQGPPSNDGADTKDVKINADETCGDGWICEHRWQQISHMAKFRNVCNFQPVQNWWDNWGNQIAFSRGNKGFIAINNENFAMDVNLKTGLPGGVYCDIISGDKINNSCTGKSINVNPDGTAHIYIKYYDENPIIAIHAESKLN